MSGEPDSPDPRVVRAPEDGTYYVTNHDGVVETWKTGARYRLISVLGHGSFGAVCKARDVLARRVVAMKRVPNALCTLENAKRVLREVVVLNRLDHPNIIKIYSIFHAPSSAGPSRMDPTTFSLVPMSIDLYMVFECAEGGDLYEIRGEMSSREVRSLMKQLTTAIKYMHDVGVWHRDIKSANLLCGRARFGGRVVKVCDFGLARGARRGGRDAAADESAEHLDALGGGGGDDPVPAFDDARSAKRAKKKRSSLDAATPAAATPAPPPGAFARQEMLTGVVATPCYRAPEVIMSNGAYTGAMDVWSLGCIFGELLQRSQQHAYAPRLTVRPLFRFDDDPVPTPGEGEMYTGWARGMRRTSGGGGGEGASGSGSGRGAGAGAGSYEHLQTDVGDDAHSARVKARLDLFFDVIGTPSWYDVEAVSNVRWRRYLRGIRGRPGSITEDYKGCDEVARDLLLRMLTFDPKRRAGLDEILAHAYFAEDPDEPHPGGGGGGGDAASADRPSRVDATDAGGGGGGAAGGERTRFWEMSNPRDALAALELDFASVSKVERDPNPTTANAWRDHFKALFEMECRRETRSGEARDGGGWDDDDGGSPGGLSEAFPLFFHAGEAAVPYAGTARSREEEGAEALERYLSLGDAAGGVLQTSRQKEWAEMDLPSADRARAEAEGARSTWGVSAMPPGMTEQEGWAYLSMNNQQSR